MESDFQSCTLASVLVLRVHHLRIRYWNDTNGNVPFFISFYFSVFQEAKQYIAYGTRVVDLDGNRILVNIPDVELDSEAVPTPIVSMIKFATF